LSFSHHASLDFKPAWSHARMHVPGARFKSALPGVKNPALKNTLAGYLSSLSPFPFLFYLVQVGLRFQRSVLLHVSRKLRSSWAK